MNTWYTQGIGEENRHDSPVLYSRVQVAQLVGGSGGRESISRAPLQTEQVEGLVSLGPPSRAVKGPPRTILLSTPPSATSFRFYSRPFS